MHSVSRLLIKKFASKTEREEGLPGRWGRGTPDLKSDENTGNNRLHETFSNSGNQRLAVAWRVFIIRCILVRTAVCGTFFFPTYSHASFPRVLAGLAATAGGRLGLDLLRSPILTRFYCLTYSTAFWKTPRVVTWTDSELSRKRLVHRGLDKTIGSYWSPSQQPEAANESTGKR